MLTRNEVKESVSEEIRIVRHLATKLDPARLDWRPSPDQRSTVELLRYLALCGIAPATAILEADWGVVQGFRDRHAQLGLDGFDDAMTEQETDVHALIDSIPDGDWTGREGKLPWGSTRSLAEAFFQTTVRFLVAYRMQLFLYAKASGAAHLGTYDAWMGMDQPAAARA